MKDLLSEDLARWEGGRLSLEDLEARHRGAGVRDVTGLWVRLSALTREPVPDAQRGWAEVVARLPDRRREKAASAWRTRRRVVAVLAAALLAIGSAAYALGPAEIRDAVNGAVSRIADLFRSGPPDHHRLPPPATSPPALAPTPARDSGQDPKPGPSVRPPESPQYRPPAVKVKHEPPKGGPRDEGTGQVEPTPQPSPEESEGPSPEPSEEPTEEPIDEPTSGPTPEPSMEASPSPDA